MMYGYYGSGSEGWSGLWAIGMHVHVLFGLLLLLGVVAGVVWMVRFAKPEQLKRWFWIAVLLGVLGVLVTAPMAYFGMQNMMQSWYDREQSDSSTSTSVSGDDDERYRGMMDWWFDQYKEDQSAADTTTNQ